MAYLLDLLGTDRGTKGDVSKKFRQVEDKYISKNRHNSHVKTSRECSPFRSSGKSSSHSSPSARKRGYISPNLSSKSSTSPYENSRTKKDRAENDMGKNDCVISDPRTESKLDDDMVIKRVSCRRCPVNGFKEEDWSEHLSSSGKIYYYNKRTEESQWEVPKGWHDRNDRDHDSKECSHKERSSRSSVNSSSKESNNRDEYREVREVRDPRENKDYKYREKNSSSSSKDHRLSDSRSYRDLRKSREKESRESRDRDYRDREGRDYDGKHRHTPGSSKRDLKYSVRSTIGLSTPSSSSSSSSHRSYRRSTSNSVNGGAGSGSGNVQDISPPGTPTNDDIVIITTVCSTPVAYTTQSSAASASITSSSPLITTPVAASTTTRVPPPTTPHTPIVLSPVVHSTTPTISTSYLHPLQQALLLQQQQSTTTVTTKETFGSPKLPTVKNHVQEVVQVSTPTSSPRVSLTSTPQQQKSIPMVQSPEILDRSITPPPPPPPPKETSKNFNESSKDRTPKPERQNSSTPIATTPVAALVPQAVEPSPDQIEINNRTKIPEVQPADESPVKITYRAFNTERLIKKTIKLEREELVTFTALPDIEQYSEYFSPSVADLNTSFYCNALENQISSTWEETMSMLHTEGYRSKFNLAMCRQNVDCQDCKLDVSSGWVDALNSVIQKVESLQDSSMSSEARSSSRDSKSNSTKRNRLDTLNNDSSSDGCEKGDNNSETIEHNSKEKNSMNAITEPLNNKINNNNINDPSQVPPGGCNLGSAPSEINNSSR